MNEMLHRSLCTFIIYYTTLRNKTANDKLTLFQLCTLCNDMCYQGSSPPEQLLIGDKQKDPKEPSHLGLVTDCSYSAFIKFYQGCFKEVENSILDGCYTYNICTEWKHKSHPWHAQEACAAGSLHGGSKDQKALPRLTSHLALLLYSRSCFQHPS